MIVIFTFYVLWSFHNAGRELTRLRRRIFTAALRSLSEQRGRCDIEPEILTANVAISAHITKPLHGKVNKRAVFWGFPCRGFCTLSRKGHQGAGKVEDLRKKVVKIRSKLHDFDEKVDCFFLPHPISGNGQRVSSENTVAEDQFWKSSGSNSTVSIRPV